MVVVAVGIMLPPVSISICSISPPKRLSYLYYFMDEAEGIPYNTPPLPLYVGTCTCCTFERDLARLIIRSWGAVDYDDVEEEEEEVEVDRAL